MYDAHHKVRIKDSAIVAAVGEVLDSEGQAETVADLAGETLLVTAGGTREAIDPVRFIGNRSSGRMGFEIAEAAARRETAGPRQAHRQGKGAPG